MNNVEAIREFLKQNAQERTVSTEAYTGAQHIDYGVSVPVMRDFIKTWTNEHKKALTYEDWLTLLDTLYHGESVQEKTITGMLLTAFPKFRRQVPLETFDVWLGQLVGWLEVDSTCQSVFTPADYLVDWDAWAAFLRRLAQDGNINKRRASLVLLIKSVRSDDKRFLTLALELVDQLKHEKDKLITKAISWILREASKKHHTEIDAYVAANRQSLPTIAVREVTRKLQTGKKQP